VFKGGSGYFEGFFVTKSGNLQLHCWWLDSVDEPSGSERVGTIFLET